ncbi:MAG: alpha-L-fucosidase [Terrimicrobiaceae bacterium]
MPHLSIPSQAQLSWQQTETNAFFHFGLNTFTGREWGDGTESPSVFNPSTLDCLQWARVARAGGFQIAILTAKHHDGFCLWPTKTTNYSVKSAPWKNGGGDLVREFTDAFRSEGLKVGLYLSPWDRHEPSYGDSPCYNDFYCEQLTELLTGYGELHEVWFDGACTEGSNGCRQEYDWERFFQLVKNLQPGAVTFGDGGTDVRWCGNERGFSGETCWSTVDPNRIRFPGDSGICEANDATANANCSRMLNEGEEPLPGESSIWRPAECDVSIRPGWFYHDSEDHEVRTVDNLVDLYFQSVGRNSLLLLNMPPTPEGLIHPVDAERVLAFRREIDRCFSVDLARNARVADGGGGALVDGSPDTWWDFPEACAAVEIWLERRAFIGIISLREAVQFGQRVAAWRLEATRTGEDWIPVASGTTVGLKRLVRVPPFEAAAVRLVIERSLGSPVLTGISLYL